MVTRRECIAGIAASLGLAAGCTAIGSRPSESCSITQDDVVTLIKEGQPAERWLLGDEIADPAVEYRPRRVTLVNAGPSRTYDLSIDRGSTETVLSTSITLSHKEFARIVLQEPAVWHLSISSPGQPTITETVKRFDCNFYSRYFWVRCDGTIEQGGGTTLIGCPTYPLNQSSD